MAERATAVQPAKESAITKPAIIESPFERVNALFDTISRRAYDLFTSSGRIFGHELGDWLRTESETLHPVHIHVSESGNTLEVKAEVPGFNEKELEIHAEPRRLVLSGKRESKKDEKKGKAVVYSESCSDQILRVVDLPSDVETEKVTAVLKNGVLDVTLSKAAKARTVRIEPKAA